ncbi:MAG: hypothetical protein LBU04_02615 [Christensenellaceae bacterium]|nr:hypothetical protein [Christensenellaceae bacterium]
MIFTFDDLMLRFNEYTDIKGRIRREVQSGRLTQITRGLYESNMYADGKYLAVAIYGPSYLSFDYVLSLYSLIPEFVYKTYTSATFNKGKIKRHENSFGLFTYRDVPNDVYNIGVEIREGDGYSYQIATPEKALCDKLYSLPPVKSLCDLRTMLFDDLRIDEISFWELNLNDIQEIAPLYRATNLKLLLKLMRRKINCRQY